MPFLGPCAAIWVPPACSPTCFGEIFDPRRSAWSLPGKAVTAQATLRGLWLDSAKDAQIGSGVRDPAGDSGDDVGWQFDARLVWRPAPRWTLDGALRC